MNLLTDMLFSLCTIIFNIIVTIFTNPLVFIVVFIAIGIATYQHSKGAGIFWIVLALIVLGNTIF